MATILETQRPCSVISPLMIWMNCSPYIKIQKSVGTSQMGFAITKIQKKNWNGI